MTYVERVLEDLKNRNPGEKEFHQAATEILLTLDREIPQDITLNEDCVENITCNPSVTVRNNRFGPSMARGMLCLTRGKTVVENNYFYKTGSCVLHIENDCCSWYESGRLGEILFRNNTVDGCNYGVFGDANPVIYVGPRTTDDTNPERVFEKIVIENNRFINPPNGKYDMQFGLIKRVEIKGNVFENGYTVSKNRADVFIEAKE